jgi:hypothetical protein
MSTLTMPLADAILVSTALLHHASADDITPVITHAAVLELLGNRYLVATDRYSFGRFLLGADDQVDIPEGESPMIPRDALTWVSKITTRSLRRGFAASDYTLRFTWGDTKSGGREVELAIMFDGASERMQTYDVILGNFPPVARLWKDDTGEGKVDAICLSHGSLLKIAADVALFEGKPGNVLLDFTASDNPNKPGPVQYTLGKRWTAAIQPNNVLR